MGKLYTWGWADSGRLGNNTTTPNVTAPAAVDSDTTWDQISLGFGHALAIKNGQLYAWGDNAVNELGDGTTTDSLVPLLINSDTDWEMVSAGSGLSLAIKAGKLYSWGSNGSGRTAQNTLSGNTTTPTQVGTATDWDFVSASKSQPFAVAIKGGQLYAWGIASYGALGNGVTTGSYSTPQLINSDTDWSSLSAGARHVLAIKAGKLYSWGAAANGRLGNGTTTPDVSTPTQVGTDTTWEKVASGNTGSQDASLAIKGGKLYSCGYGSAMGRGVANNFTDTTTFTQVGSATDWSDVSAGADHAHGLRGGALYGWGTNAYSQIGDTSSTTRNDPVQIGSATTWVKIAGGRRFSAAIENTNVAPANTAAPTVSGTAKVGQTLTTTDGTWTGTPTPTYARKWQVSDNGTSGWTDISGATSSTFTITSAQSGKYIRSQVTATNVAGSATASSSATAQIVENPAVSTPTISGTAKVGQVLTGSASATAGFPSPSLSYQWQVADTSGGSYSNISGATSSTFTLTDSQAGKFIKVQATATNSEGTDSKTSSATSQVLQNPAVSTPTISGTAKVGQVLTGSASATAGFPSPSLSYQWQVADTSGGSYSNISGATSSTFTLTDSQAGKFIKVQATATNSEGTDSKTSSATSQVLQNPAVSTPTISGTAKVGEVLTASASATAGFPSPSLSYQWQRSDNGTTWHNIHGETASTLTLVNNEAGKYIRVEATATNSEGSDTKTSTATAQVIRDLAIDIAPALSGTAKVGENLETSFGTWDGFPAPTVYSFQWEVSDDGLAGWTEVIGQTSQTTTLVSTQAGKYLRVKITADNGIDTADAYSNPSEQVTEAPAIDTPTLSGIAKTTETLTAAVNITAGFPAPTLTYEFESSPDGVNDWSSIQGPGSSSDFTPAFEAGKYIRVTVVADNGVDSAASDTSEVVGPVTQDPVIDTPFVSGQTKVGQTLSATANATEGFPAPSITYQWRRADTSDGIYWPISGATSSTYVLQSADLNKFIKVEATATNSEGSNSQLSTALGPITEDAPQIQNEGTGAIIGAIKVIRGF